MSLDDEARQFWGAAYFYRRAPHRDRTKAAQIIRHLATSPITRIARLARALLKEIESEPANHD